MPDKKLGVIYSSSYSGDSSTAISVSYKKLS